MATKLNNWHLNNILENCKEYKILDVYIALAHAATETKSYKYLIQTYNNNISELVYVVNKNINSSYKTISNCLNTLISMGIIQYEETLSAWCLVNMEKMTQAKDSNITESEEELLKGYTNIRNFFFTDTFYNMKAREKRLVMFLCQLNDSKSSQFYKDFSINLLKPGSPWLKIIKTKSVYYAKYTIQNMLSKYKDLFTDLSDSLREKDLAPQHIRTFKFLFKSDEINNKTNLYDMIELIQKKNPKEYAFVKEKIKFANITLTKQQVMHLVRGISTLKEWFLKERVVQIIVNKYIAIQIHKSRENIKSLPAYVAAVIKAILNEYSQFIQLHKNNNAKQNIADFNNIEIDDNSYTSKVLKLIAQFS
ncbi:MAG: hypothetical protein KIC94_18695 [Clostridiales bacterium]|nr:hypothetical protein [Clostridiales bacterium]